MDYQDDKVFHPYFEEEEKTYAVIHEVNTYPDFNE